MGHISESYFLVYPLRTNEWQIGNADSVFLHLLRRLQKNDSNILELLPSHNNEIFLRCFKSNLYLFPNRFSDKQAVICYTENTDIISSTVSEPTSHIDLSKLT